MPVSSSEPRTGWRRKRKRPPQIGQRPKLQDDEEDEEDNDEDEDDLEQHEFEQGQRHQQQNSQSRLDPHNIGPLSEAHLGSGEKISDFPPAIKHKLNRPHSFVSTIVALERAIQRGESRSLQNGVVFENISHGQLQALSVVPRDSPSLWPTGDLDKLDVSTSSASSYVISPPPLMDGRGVIKRFGGNRVLVVPMHAEWFAPQSIHRLERQVVPHFFTGKSNDHSPENYLGCRNLIIAKYMENPERRILVSDCEGLEVGIGIDIEDLTRIVRFLDNWGIINYCAAASPNFKPRNHDSCLMEDSNGEVQVPSSALKSIDSLIQFDKPKCSLRAENVYHQMSSGIANGDCDLDRRIRERLSENRCSYCSLTLSTTFYLSQKEVDVLACFDCYHDGKFVVGHSSLDFVRMDSTKGYGDYLDSESWTDQETLLLLEAIETYNDNWNEIADHVGTKSKSQCILHFVRLPVEDGQLESIEVPAKSQMSNDYDPRRPGTCLQESDSDRSLLFANSKNPVMSLVAFLTSAVGPRVAAACAHTSLSVLTADGLDTSKNIEQMQSTKLANRMNMETLCNNNDLSHGENANSSKPKGCDSGLHGSLLGKQLRSAAQAGLSAAATKAKLFADHEEREIQRLSANIINNQLKRLELKLKQFAEIETLLMKECEQVERSRQRLAGDRAQVLSGQFGNNINQQHISSSSTPYGTSQSIHPQFMPHQPMYGLGARLPLSAIHPSSTASTAMFNSAANPQLRPGLGLNSSS